MKRYFPILSFILSLIAISFVSANSADNSFVLVLDAGHGGRDPGAIGSKGKEKNINLAVTLLTGKYISERHPDVKVIYTRRTDVFIGLDERANVANRSNADLFISVHTNASTSKSLRGPEVYTFGVSRTKENLEVAQRENAVILLEDNYEETYEGFDPNSIESYIMFEFIQNKFVEQSIDFAFMVQNQLKTCVKWAGYGVKQAQYLVLRKSAMPRILVELDFITNSEAEKILLSEAGQKKYAKAICDAFTQYKTDYDRKNRITKNTSGKIIEDKKVEKNRKDAGKKIVYKVQILASARKLVKNSKLLKGYKADYYVDKGLYKYTVGESADWEEISEIRASLLKDFKDAFIVKFENGIRVQN
ncbi:MAG: N-acetylmuramoyl-L-alanine amidase [Dysgonamonadaceae bacterium]|nr:N-acetylmuramoyl-L-alanine amidase [Dysgonamonadaceae bacterium]